MRKLFYMGLESYEARYTLQLTDWNRRVFDRRGLDVVYVPGTTIRAVVIEVSEDGENGCSISYNLTRPTQSIVI